MLSARRRVVESCLWATRVLIAAWALAGPARAAAADGFAPALARDINTSTTAASSFPQNFTLYAGKAVFSALHPTLGMELWVTDGNGNGTVLFKDANPTGHSAPHDIKVNQTLLWFSAYDPAAGREPWVGAGSSASTKRVADIFPGPGGSSPQFPAAFGTGFVFSANDGEHGQELWFTDGTPLGTRLVADVRPGPESSNPHELTAMGASLIFAADDGEFGTELWKTDGTAEGTSLVEDIRFGPFNSNPENLILYKGRIYFTAIDAIEGRELWRTDGSEEGTEIFAAIGFANTGGFADKISFVFSNPRMAISNNRLFFAANDGVKGYELWRTEGTPGTTLPMRDINLSGSSYPMELTDHNGLLLFSAEAKGNIVAGVQNADRELYKSDGTFEGTIRVNDIREGDNSASPRGFVTVGGFSYFSADDGVNGRELWRTGGTFATTTRLTDIAPGENSAEIGPLLAYNNQVLFSASDGVTGSELWKYIPASSATTRLRDIFSGSATRSASIGLPVAAGDSLYFTADDGFGGKELWFSDPANPQGASPLLALPGKDELNPSAAAFYHGELYFVPTAGTAPGELWKVAPGQAAATLVKNISASAQSSPADFFLFDNLLYFTANDSDHGRELWRTNGTAQGTVMAFDIGEESASSDPALMTEFNGSLYFVASSVLTGRQLFRADPGGSTPEQVTAMPGLTGPQELTVFGGRLYFSGDDGSSGRELWSTDGSIGNTTRVKDINPGSNGSSPLSLTEMNGKLYFTAEATGLGRELWSSDGTTTFTLVMKDILPGPQGGFNGSSPRLARAGDRLFFSATDGAHGAELWSSDGTSTNTALLRDIQPGTAGSQPVNLTPLGDGIFFTASDNDGHQLWRSDGTATGTYMFDLIHPLSAFDFSPGRLARAGRYLYLFADDGSHGEELWRIEALAENAAREWSKYP